MTDRQTYDIPEVAQMLGVSRGATYRMVQEGVIPSIRLGKRRVVVPKSAMSELLNSPEVFESGSETKDLEPVEVTRVPKKVEEKKSRCSAVAASTGQRCTRSATRGDTCGHHVDWDKGTSDEAGEQKMDDYYNAVNNSDDEVLERLKDIGQAQDFLIFETLRNRERLQMLIAIAGFLTGVVLVFVVSEIFF